MRALMFILGMVALLVGSRAASAERFGSLRRRIHNWFEETHSTGFELRRHFFRRFFDSDFVSTPGEWRVVAIGALAILLSSSIIFAQAYYHKYSGLDALDTPEPY